MIRTREFRAKNTTRFAVGDVVRADGFGEMTATVIRYVKKRAGIVEVRWNRDNSVDILQDRAMVCYLDDNPQQKEGK